MSTHVDVTVRQGILRGVVVRNTTGCCNFIAFCGIPYAKPPIGELRFRDPQPVEPWFGIRDACQFSNVALQFEANTKKPIGNEDCLYLNVYTIDINDKCPVMVWIHGSCFVSGSGNNHFYGPDYIIRKQVVLVTLNYRLGVLGFLNLDNEAAPGNQGLKDVLMALRWVRDNISNFGGDPQNVTIFGQDSGGCMVHYLATCPQADGLFHKAISQSGTAAITMAYSEKETQKVRSFRLVRKLGKRIADPKDAVAFLRTIDARDIVKATEDILSANEIRQKILPFVPTVDCDSTNPFFVEHPATLLRRGVKVPYIIGFNSCEGFLLGISTDENTLEIANSNFASIIHPRTWPILMEKKLTVEDVRFRYFGNEPVSKESIMNFITFVGDMHFHYGIIETIRFQALANHYSTYVYQFSYESSSSLAKQMLNITYPGAIHGEELYYLFCARCNCELCKMGFGIIGDPEKWMISDRLTQMWTDFAKTGNPTPTITSSVPIKWLPQLSEDEYRILIINKYLRLEIMQKDQLRFHEAI